MNEPLRFDRRSQRREGNHSPFSLLDGDGARHERFVRK